jgi:hypothetical protein
MADSPSLAGGLLVPDDINSYQQPQQHHKKYPFLWRQLSGTVAPIEFSHGYEPSFQEIEYDLLQFIEQSNKVNSEPFDEYYDIFLADHIFG